MKFKMLTLALLASITSTVFAETVNQNIPRCFNETNVAEAIKNGDYFDENRTESFVGLINNPMEISEDYKILSYSEPKLITSDKLTIVPPYENCRAQWTYAIIDYKMELSNGKVCQDTLAAPYKRKHLFTSCPVVTTLQAPLVVIYSPIGFVEFLDDSANAGYLKTSKGKLKYLINKIFEEKLK